jgi:hypothetical protein
MYASAASQSDSLIQSRLERNLPATMRNMAQTRSLDISSSNVGRKLIQELRMKSFSLRLLRMNRMPKNGDQSSSTSGFREDFA